MTFSILAVDEETGRLGGAAATGSLCVGGWVLRGDAEAGMSASQGTAPSTLWGEGVLAEMRSGAVAEEAVVAVTSVDPGRDWRQLAAMDRSGASGAFTGQSSVPVAGAIPGPGVVVAGNMLAHASVLDAMLEAFLTARGAFPERLIAALKAGEAAGSDVRGLKSAALLVVGRDIAPLTLRIDHDTRPLAALERLYGLSCAQPYSDWTAMVPTLDDPFRACEPQEATGELIRR